MIYICSCCKLTKFSGTMRVSSYGSFVLCEPCLYEINTTKGMKSAYREYIESKIDESWEKNR